VHETTTFLLVTLPQIFTDFEKNVTFWCQAEMCEVDVLDLSVRCPPSLTTLELMDWATTSTTSPGGGDHGRGGAAVVRTSPAWSSSHCAATAAAVTTQYRLDPISPSSSPASSHPPSLVASTDHGRHLIILGVSSAVLFCPLAVLHPHHARTFSV